MCDVRLRVLAACAVATLRPRLGRGILETLEPKQPLHLMPHGDAQIDAERQQGEHDQPEANVGRATRASAPQPSLTPRPLASIFLANDSRVVDENVRRRLPLARRHPQQCSGPTGRIPRLSPPLDILWGGGRWPSTRVKRPGRATAPPRLERTPAP